MAGVLVNERQCRNDTRARSHTHTHTHTHTHKQKDTVGSQQREGKHKETILAHGCGCDMLPIVVLS